MERRFNCIYIKLVIIHYLCVAFESDIIRRRIQKPMYKEKSWTSTKSTKDIKIINNIILPQYDQVLGQCYGHQILAANHYYDIKVNFAKTRKKNKRGSLCSRIRYSLRGRFNPLESAIFGTFQKFLYIFNNSSIYKYIVFLIALKNVLAETMLKTTLILLIF